MSRGASLILKPDVAVSIFTRDTDLIEHGATHILAASTIRHTNGHGHLVVLSDPSYITDNHNEEADGRGEVHRTTRRRAQERGTDQLYYMYLVTRTYPLYFLASGGAWMKSAKRSPCEKRASAHSTYLRRSASRISTPCRFMCPHTPPHPVRGMA